MHHKQLKPIFAALALTSIQTPAQEIYQDGWIDRNKNGEQDPYENPDLSTDERIADLLGQMNMDEKDRSNGHHLWI